MRYQQLQTVPVSSISKQVLWRLVWVSLSPELPEVLSGLTSNPWYFRALEIHLYKTWTKKGRKPGGHELPLVRQMTCSFINETITLEGGSKRVPSSLYNPQFSQAIPFNWAMTMEYLIVARKFEEATSSEPMFLAGLRQSGISPACGDGCSVPATLGGRGEPFSHKAPSLPRLAAIFSADRGGLRRGAGGWPSFRGAAASWTALQPPPPPRHSALESVSA